MPVAINADPSDLMFEGSFDPSLAAEKGVKYTLTCEECGRKKTGTSFDLAEYKWEWNLKIDEEEMVQLGGQALCGHCNEDIDESEIGPEDEENEEEELQPWEKAAEDDSQKNLGDLL